jgi:O-antigen ligase
VARLATGVATSALALMPIAMWLASRSAPLLLSIAAIACLIALAREAGGAGMRAAILWHGPLASPRVGAALGLGGFLLLALVSILWSHDRLASLRAYGELCVSVAAGAVVAAILPGRSPGWAGRALAVSLALTCILTMAELSGINGWREFAGLRTQTFVFNRTLVTAILLAIPLVAWLAGARAFAAASLMLALLVGATLKSDSGAAKLGLLAVAFAVPASWLAPRLSVLVAAAGLVALFAFAPVQGEITDRAIPSAAHRQLQDSHSRDRVDIWLSYGEAIRARPLLGSGFGASATLQRHEVARAVPEARRTLLAVGHPHSAQVQAWVETGLAGAALLLLAALNLLVVIARLPGVWRIAAMGAFAGAVAIAAVGHGAWQGWWIASLGASITWFRLFMAQSRRDALAGQDPEN